jgi:lipoic acid synthetase
LKLVQKPKWLKVKLPTGHAYKNIRKVTKSYNLHTICESGNCPNMGECWGEGTATFMILGQFPLSQMVCKLYDFVTFLIFL